MKRRRLKILGNSINGIKQGLTGKINEGLVIHQAYSPVGPETLRILSVMSHASILAKYLLYLLKYYLRDYCSTRTLELVSNPLLFFSLTIYTMSME